MVSAVTTEVIQPLESELRPSLHYAGIVEGRMPGDTPFGRWTGTEPELLGVTYSYSDGDLAAAKEAAQCHETQFDAASREQLIPFLASTVRQGETSFREAF